MTRSRSIISALRSRISLADGFAFALYLSLTGTCAAVEALSQILSRTRAAQGNTARGFRAGPGRSGREHA